MVFHLRSPTSKSWSSCSRDLCLSLYFPSVDVKTRRGAARRKQRLLTSYYKCCSCCIEQRGGPCASPSIIRPTRSSCKCDVLSEGHPSAISNEASPPSLLIIDTSQGKPVREIRGTRGLFEGGCIKIETLCFIHDTLYEESKSKALIENHSSLLIFFKKNITGSFAS